MVTLLSIFYPLEMISRKSETPLSYQGKKTFKKSKLATHTFLVLGDDREIKPHAREQTTNKNGELEKFSLASLLTLHFP